MANTLLLDGQGWDLLVDASGDIAMASEPYSLAQDAASAVKTFFGECYYATNIGIKYLTQIFGFAPPPLALLKQEMEQAAQAVDDVGAAAVYISSLTRRTLAGQVQVVSASTGQVSAAPFAVVSLQGVG